MSAAWDRYAQDYLAGLRAEKAGDYHIALEHFYQALRSALFSLMRSPDSDWAQNANEGRFRCYRALRALDNARGGQ